MKAADPIDAARVELLLAELRLPAVKLVWADLAAQADKEGWPAARFVAALAEHEIAERGRRRIERHLAEAKLPPGKTIDRALRAVRQQAGRATHRKAPPSAAIRRAVPVRTFDGWDDPSPGFIEADLVSHSGPVAKGDPPPLKWSTLSYGFARKEDRNAEEELQAGRDRRQAAPG